MVVRKGEGDPRVNRGITAKEVLIIDENGVKLGVLPTSEGIAMAEEKMLDLVEVAPQANPPVCRILDYGKYRYQLQKREKDARKKQKVQTLKEMKMRPKIDEHDYNFKVKVIKNFLEDGHRVKVSVFFRGREMAFLNKGEEVLSRVVQDCSGLGRSEGRPRMEGRYMRIMMTPLPQAQLKQAEKSSAKDGSRKASDNSRQAKNETLPVMVPSQASSE
ncbi:MAG: translation initiation factor IF-3 [Synergistota bacterium]|nr:translation initiation factor IF-3 [Synergistota bacterium]